MKNFLILFCLIIINMKNNYKDSDTLDLDNKSTKLKENLNQK